jgi:integrase
MTLINKALVADPPPVPEGQRKIRIFDEKLPGFFVEVWRSGVMTFYVRYQDQRCRQREMRIGRSYEVTAEQARKRAQEIRARARLGGDPAAERDRLKNLITFGDFVEKRYLPFAKSRLKSYRDHESFYRLRLKGRWGNRRLDEVTPQDVGALQDDLRAEGLSNATVNRYTVFVRRIFNLALEWEAFEGRNPARKAPMAREEHREKYLDEVELRALFRALDEEENRVSACAIALLAATGARKGEALNARWEHVDLARRIWTVPLSKSGRRRHIPLSDMALRILERVPRQPGSPWVFPGRKPDRPVRCLFAVWRRVKARAGLDRDFRLHDLRHTFASSLVSKGRSLYEVSQILGHSKPTMTMRYAHLAPQRLIEAANLALPDFTVG